MTLEELNNISNGAHFFRADLHIHSFGASHDVRDTTMTVDAIVEKAIEERLDVISLTDHNEIRSVGRAIEIANGRILVIPGVELSTPQGHLLAYLPSLDSLERFFGRIAIADRDSQNSRCQTSILDCLNTLEALNGIGILAHVEVNSGFEFENRGNSPHKIDVLCHSALLGIEIKNATADVFYSESDPDASRVAIGKQRIAKLKLGANQFLARVMSSDAHTLTSLGRNARGDRKVTRIKMATPTFDAFRIALQDGDARIRIEDQIPLATPRIAGVSLNGGFLDGQKINFSSNLNCIIGGRGTGKSTTFEAARCLKGEDSDNPVVDSEVWPHTIFLIWCDQAGQYHRLKKTTGSKLINVDNPQDGPTSFQVECYTQGETEKISKHAQTNPIALLTYLDRFIDIGSLREAENKERNELLSIQTEIEKANKQVELIPLAERTLAVTQQQLAALEKVKAKEVIELLRQVASEGQIRTQILSKSSELKDVIEKLSPTSKINEIAALADPKKLAIGSVEFEKIVMDARSFENTANQAQTSAKEEYSKFDTEIKTQLASWGAKESATLSTIETKRKELAALNIPLDMLYIQKLAKQEAEGITNLATLKTWKPHLDAQKKLYKDTLRRRWDARERIAMTRGAYAKEASATLKSVLTDLSVSLKFAKSAYSPSAEEQIKQAMGWKTIQVPRAAMMIRQLSMPGLLEAIETKDSAKILSVLTKEKTPLFDRNEADKIITQLSVPQIKFALERCEVYDWPQLIVTKSVKNPQGQLIYSNRDFSKLSLGQQQSVLLALVLSSKSNAPLLIDQPEDNLDGEFIYHSLVPVLRLAKERRQIIVVTHNANISVLGDAEQIIVLKSTNDKSMIVSNGSIDDTTTREITCNILEGAREAFQRRAKIYGIK